MLELLLCSSVTILPDYLFRRYAQGKRFGTEITLFSVWFELRYGIVACLLLTISLITVIFYCHPTTSSALSFFRTVTILPEAGGRVAEIYVSDNEVVAAGQPLFRLDDSQQKASLESAKGRVGEIEAAKTLAQSDLLLAQARLDEARSSYNQALQELETRTELSARNSGVVSQREIERLEITVEGRRAGIDAANASVDAAKAQIEVVLPAQKASAEAALAEAQVALDKTVVRAGIDGRLVQFILRQGDFVSPVLRPAGILIPTEAGRLGIQAGFGQVEAQVIKTGMAGEATCVSKPFTVIPLVVTQVQDVIAGGQVRPTDQLLDAQARVPGTLLVYLEPLYEGGLDGVLPGSSCIVNAYTNNHDRLESEDLGTMTRIALHAVDATGIVHAGILRLQTLMLPVQTLVLSGH